MLVRPKDFLCCAGWDFVCPGTSKVARLGRNEGTNMHLTKLFFFASIFPIHIFFFSLLPFLSFSYFFFS